MGVTLPLPDLVGERCPCEVRPDTPAAFLPRGTSRPDGSAKAERLVQGPFSWQDTFAECALPLSTAIAVARGQALASGRQVPLPASPASNGGVAPSNGAVGRSPVVRAGCGSQLGSPDPTRGQAGTGLDLPIESRARGRLQGADPRAPLGDTSCWRSTRRPEASGSGLEGRGSAHVGRPWARVSAAEADLADSARRPTKGHPEPPPGGSWV